MEYASNSTFLDLIGSSPESKISELFNVNYWIVSEASPILASSNFFGSIGRRIHNLFSSEFYFRLMQLTSLGVPKSWVSLFGSKVQKGNINIQPLLSESVIKSLS